MPDVIPNITQDTIQLYQRLETYIQTEIAAQDGDDALFTVTNDMRTWFSTNILNGLQQLGGETSRISSSLTGMSGSQILASLQQQYASSQEFLRLQSSYFSYLESQAVRYFGRVPSWFQELRDIISSRNQAGATASWDEDTANASPATPAGNDQSRRIQEDAGAPVTSGSSGDRISATLRPYISRMVEGESLVRLGPIWYGDDLSVTVPRISYFSGKQVDVIPVIRAETAAAFASSRSPVDRITLELVIHYSKFSSHVQRLVALSQITPVIPVMNPVVAAITQPLDGFRDVYVAYGFLRAAELDVTHATQGGAVTGDLRALLMTMYATVPVQMKIDNIHLESIRGASRDLRVLVTLTRVLTANSYGDRTLYVKTLDGARKQHEYLSSLSKKEVNIEQMKSVSSVLGVDADAINRMISALQDRQTQFEGNRWTNAVLLEVMSGDTVKIQLEGRTVPQLFRLAGVRAPECAVPVLGHTRTEPFGYAARNRLRELLPIGPVMVIRYGTDQTTDTEVIIGRVGNGTDSDSDPAPRLLGEGLVLYTGTNLPDDIQAQYTVAMDQARSQRRGVHGSSYFRSQP